MDHNLDYGIAWMISGGVAREPIPSDRDLQHLLAVRDAKAHDTASRLSLPERMRMALAALRDGVRPTDQHACTDCGVAA